MGRDPREVKMKDRISTYFEVAKREEEKLRKLSQKPKVSAKEKAEKDIMMAKASEFVENGIPFEMAPEELQNHHFFKIGYDVAVRKQRIANSNKGMGGR